MASTVILIVGILLYSMGRYRELHMGKSQGPNYPNEIV